MSGSQITRRNRIRYFIPAMESNAEEDTKAAHLEQLCVPRLSCGWQHEGCGNGTFDKLLSSPHQTSRISLPHIFTIGGVKASGKADSGNNSDFDSGTDSRSRIGRESIKTQNRPESVFLLQRRNCIRITDSRINS
ncbi:hypothetical protein DFH07DRAFT_781792 [Mycena maculata]|uniref:Uncharacterized protein n=1 Tax=Mycena maculata TaxID=230809 RepID=A0AAD7MTC3_9AGAR|nr:hypothetical protein DFH07DRAFT_781792 [Mycena maculata]